jgi:NADH:ubiquinone oxidoreductase subunit 6 (subunit J)
MPDLASGASELKEANLIELFLVPLAVATAILLAALIHAAMVFRRERRHRNEVRAIRRFGR